MVDDSAEAVAKQLLYERRAKTILHFLENRVNLSEAEISTAGKGDTEPIGDNKIREGQSANRRVEILVE